MRILVCTGRDLKGSIAANVLCRELAHKHQLKFLLCDGFLRRKSTPLPQECSEGLVQRDFLVDGLFPYLNQRLAIQRVETHERAELVDDTSCSSFSESASESTVQSDAYEMTPLQQFDHLELNMYKPFYTFKGISDRYGVSVRVLEKTINNAANMAEISEFAPDLILSVRFLHIFKTDLIRLPRYGVWNLHPGKLPEFRGLYCDLQAVCSNAESMHMTLHEINEGIDTGSIIDVAEVPISPSKSMLDHRIELTLRGLEMILAQIRVLEAGQAVVSVAQDPALEERAHYYSFPSSDDFATVSERGMKLNNMPLTDLLELYLPQSYESMDAFSGKTAAESSPAGLESILQTVITDSDGIASEALRVAAQQ